MLRACIRVEGLSRSQEALRCIESTNENKQTGEYLIFFNFCFVLFQEQVRYRRQTQQILKIQRNMKESGQSNMQFVQEHYQACLFKEDKYVTNLRKFDNFRIQIKIRVCYWLIFEYFVLCIFIFDVYLKIGISCKLCKYSSKYTQAYLKYLVYFQQWHHAPTILQQKIRQMLRIVQQITLRHIFYPYSYSYSYPYSYQHSRSYQYTVTKQQHTHLHPHTQTNTNLSSTNNLHMLMHKISHPQTNPKLQYLQSLEKSNSLQEYFAAKPIIDFSMEDIYYFLLNKQKFRNPPRLAALSIINDLALDCVSCFVIANQMKMIMDKQFQTKLVVNFNEGCLGMSASQIGFCVGFLKMFDKEIIRKYLGFTNVKIRMENREDEFEVHILQILHFMKDFVPLKSIVNVQNIKTIIKQMLLSSLSLSQSQPQFQVTTPSKSKSQETQQPQPQSSSLTQGKTLAKNKLLDKKTNTNHIINIKNLYYLHNLIKTLNIKITPQQSQQIESQVQKKITQAKTIQQMEYCIKFIKLFTQFTYLINLDRLNCVLYKQYLQFLLTQKQDNPSFQVLRHMTPVHAIQTANQYQFENVIKLRMGIGLENGIQLGKDVKKVPFHNLKPVYAIVKYTHENCKEQNKIWNDFQQGFINKLQLNSKYRNVQKLCSQVSIVELFKIIAYVSTIKQGSVNFWKHCHHLVHDILMHDQYLKSVPVGNQNLFIICIFQIYQGRTIPEHIQQKIIKMCLIAFVNNFWSIQQLLKLTRALAISKLGEYQIWYAIQNKILAMELMKDHKVNQHLKIPLTRIYQYFIQMNVGSFKFHKRIKSLNLDFQTQQENIKNRVGGQDRKIKN